LAVDFHKDKVMGKSRTYTTDDSTFASNPGNVTLNPFIYITFFPKWGLILASLLFISLALLKYSLLFLFLSAFIILVNWVYWINRKEHFKFGDSNPGIVIQINPTLVAVATDLSKIVVTDENGLTKGDGKYPVAKIIKVPLKKLKKGSIVGTVALYSRLADDSAPRWADFKPIVINCATNDLVEIENAIRSYTQEQLSDLGTSVSQLNTPYREGLYKIHTEHSRW
jgi:hypothetical protein